MKLTLQLKLSFNIDDNLWVYLILFELSPWKLNVGYLFMSTERFKDWNSRPSLETDLDWFRALQILLCYSIIADIP